MLFVAAAGNGHTSTLESPASISGVIAVAALDASNESAFFSNFGPDVAVAAPGQDIYSTTLNGAYQTRSGTSMAAPYVSGVAALIHIPLLFPPSIASVAQAIPSISTFFPDTAIATSPLILANTPCLYFHE